MAMQQEVELEGEARIHLHAAVGGRQTPAGRHLHHVREGEPRLGVGWQAMEMPVGDGHEFGPGAPMLRRGAVEDVAPAEQGCAERDRHQRDFYRRIGIGERAADGSARTDRSVADKGHDLREQRHLRAHERIACEHALPGCRADFDRLAFASSTPVSVAVGLWVVLAGLLSAASLLSGRPWWQGLLAAVLAVAAIWYLVRRAVRRLGGITGDVLGASVEVATTVLLVALVP